MNNLMNILLQENKDKNIKRICCKEKILLWLNDIKVLLSIPYVYPSIEQDEVSKLILKIENQFKEILSETDNKDIDNNVQIFMFSLNITFNRMKKTLEAILNSDPSCNSYQEIVLAYPSYEAILCYRIANELYRMNEKLLSRIISEEAHRNTGIDINPGAKIGENFFIDHGTGIVIGETTIIGDNVKLYQGVTLGAISLKKGRELVGIKRHPTVLNDVTIYSNASIFGGNTIIGNNSIIGANVYITESVKDYSIVYLSKDGIKVIEKR